MRGVKKVILALSIMIFPLSLLACGEKNINKISDEDITFNYDIKNRETGEIKITLSAKENLSSMTYNIYENEQEILTGEIDAGESKSIDIVRNQKKGEKYIYKAIVKDDKGTIVKKELNISVFGELDLGIPKNEEGKPIETLEKQWSSKKIEYKIGEKVSFDSKVYECIQGHTSQEAWTPKDASSLWKIKSEE